MGQTQSSIKDTINKGRLLEQKILNIANELTTQYKHTYFLNPIFCTQLALVYSNKLNQYSKEELGGVAYRLGLIADMPKTKEKLCNIILNHYHNRINLIAAIQGSIGHCSNRIFALTTGPACKGNSEIFTEPECNAAKSDWIPQYIPGVDENDPDAEKITLPDQNLDENKPFYANLTKIQNVYLDGLAELLKIMENLKSNDTVISDENLKTIDNRAKLIIKTMHYQCSNLYDISNGMRKFTKGEVAAMSNEAAVMEELTNNAAK